MDLPFFYHPEINAGLQSLLLDEDTSRHVVQVLRMQPGEQLLLTDGKGSIFTTTITDAHKKKCMVELSGDIRTTQRASRVCIAISPVKNNSRLEWFLEKATEIGVASIVPLICQRTEKQHFRYDRMKNILISAMLQSQQAWLPELHEAIPFAKYVVTDKSAQRFIAYCIDDEKRQPLNHFSPFGEAVILIGPEGDFTPDEVKLALEQGYQPVTLGSTRLRTETAGMLAAGLMVNLQVSTG